MKLRALLILAAACGAFSAAHAGRPLQSEDAGVIDDGAWEVESAHSRLVLGATRATETTLQLGRGIGARSQLALAAGHGRAEGVGARSLALGGKSELWSDRREVPAALTLAWSLGWTRSEGTRWRHAISELTLVHSRPLGGGLTLHANLGHAREEIDRRRSTTWALALEHDGVAVGDGTLAPMAEVFGDDRGARWWNTGLRWTIRPEAVWLDASWGREAGSPATRLASVGLKLAF